MKKSGSGSGSISQRHGSADLDPDPDPHQTVMDLQHCCKVWRRLAVFRNTLKTSCRKQEDTGRKKRLAGGTGRMDRTVARWRPLTCFSFSCPCLSRPTLSGEPQGLFKGTVA
jgi:hypothetical protein